MAKKELHLRKVPKQELYWVVHPPTGHKFFKGSKPEATAHRKQLLKGGGWMDDIRNALDPNKNGVAKAFDPNQNGFNDSLKKTENDLGKVFDPNKNGLADSIKNTENVLGKVFDPNKNGVAEAFSDNSQLAELFEPKRNGINSAFERFGVNTKEAFESLGTDMSRQFAKDKASLDNAFAPLKQAMNSTIGNTDWWNATMSNPDTYIFLLSSLLMVGAVVLSGGTAGPAAIAAMSVMSGATKVIGDAAQGRPISGMDIATIVMSLVPIPGAGAAATTGLKTAMNAIKSAAVGANGLTKLERAAVIGKNLVAITKTAGVNPMIGGAAPSLDLLQQMAKAAYKPAPPPHIEDWDLVYHSATLKFYRKEEDVVVAVRGSKDVRDWKANTYIPQDRLAESDRYKADADLLKQFKSTNPDFKYFAVGHSLGGAIIDGFLRENLVLSGVSYNPAVQPKDMKAGLKNERIYDESDPLYLIMGQYVDGVEVRRHELGHLATLAKYGALGIQAFVANAIDSHHLRKFEGGQS